MWVEEGIARDGQRFAVHVLQAVLAHAAERCDLFTETAARLGFYS